MDWPRGDACRAPASRRAPWTTEHGPPLWTTPAGLYERTTPLKKNTMRNIGFRSTKSGGWIAVSAEALQGKGSPRRSLLFTKAGMFRHDAPSSCALPRAPPEWGTHAERSAPPRPLHAARDRAVRVPGSRNSGASLSPGESPPEGRSRLGPKPQNFRTPAPVTLPPVPPEQVPFFVEGLLFFKYRNVVFHETFVDISTGKLINCMASNKNMRKLWAMPFAARTGGPRLVSTRRRASRGTFSLFFTTLHAGSTNDGTASHRTGVILALAAYS